jgi:hypothetical protein
MKTLAGVFIISICFIFFTSCEFDLDNSTDSDSSVVKPKIKTCKIYNYKTDTLASNEEGILMEEFEYDLNGRETKLIRYDSEGKIVCTFDYKYDKTGNLSEKIWKQASGSEKEPTRSTTLIYDLDGSTFQQNVDTNRNEKYDQSGNLVERIWNDPLKKSEIKETHHYYEGGKKREVMYFDRNNEVEKMVVYAYDSVGNEVSMIEYNKNNIVESKITYMYDEYGNIKEDIYWNVLDSIPEQIIRYVYEFY